LLVFVLVFKCCPSLFHVAGIRVPTCNLGTFLCFLLPVTVPCLQDAFRLLILCAKTLTPLGKLLRHQNTFCIYLFVFTL
jgi:hypothetical protein